MGGDPFSERHSLADALERAAGELDRGTDRFTVEDNIRGVIAQQPTSGQWAEDIGKILQTAASPDAVVYANNLRLVAKGLKEIK